MSHKLQCSGCDSYTSAVAAAFEIGEPCPYCGLPAEATAAVLKARRSLADEDLVTRYLEAERRATAVEKELALLRHRIAEVGIALESVPD